MVLNLLSAVSANTTGPAVDSGGGNISDDVSLDVFTAGTVTAFSVQFQGSIDGVEWAPIGSAITAVGLTKPASTPPACRYFQAVLSGYTGTGTVSASIGLVPLV
jgi:hypothetical protein